LVKMQKINIPKDRSGHCTIQFNVKINHFFANFLPINIF
jgi:hypothetical protein